MTGLDIGVYVPQMGFSYQDVLHRALRCEELGIGSLWLYDHMYGPGVPDMASLEAWTLATALLSRTERLRVGHMVLCNQFRHPAVLAKMATTLDQVSAGRLDLGIGSGSIEDEHTRMGLDMGNLRRALRAPGRDAGDPDPGLRQRGDRLRGHALHRARHADRARTRPAAPPAHHRRRVGEKYTLPLVARYADVWNVPTYALGELEHKVSVLRSNLRGHRPRSGHHRAVGGSRHGAGTRRRLVTEGPPDRRATIRWTRFRPARRRAHRHAAGHRRAAEGTASARIWQVVLFTHDRASDATLELLASKVITEF